MSLRKSRKTAVHNTIDIGSTHSKVHTLSKPLKMQNVINFWMGQEIGWRVLTFFNKECFGHLYCMCYSLSYKTYTVAN